MPLLDILSAALLALGCFLAITGSAGALRMPDFYTRLHAAGKVDSLAQTLILAALMLQAGLTLTTAKLLLIVLFLFATSPTAAHMLAKAAHVSGLKPWRRGQPRR
jgi:multicomponent Na+:H+ antiporter subunit G